MRSTTRVAPDGSGQQASDGRYFAASHSAGSLPFRWSADRDHEHVLAARGCAARPASQQAGNNLPLLQCAADRLLTRPRGLPDAKNSADHLDADRRGPDAGVGGLLRIAGRPRFAAEPFPDSPPGPAAARALWGHR